MGPDELVPVLEKVDLFSGLKPKLLRTIAESGQVETFAPDEVVIAEGEEVGGFRPFSQKGVEMHIVLDGSGAVSVTGESHGTVGPGDYFGELSAAGREATVGRDHCRRGRPDDVRPDQVDVRGAARAAPRDRAADAARHGRAAAGRRAPALSPLDPATRGTQRLHLFVHRSDVQ